MSCFLKEKHDSDGNLVKLKARLVAGGHMQDRNLYTGETSSPTASIHSVFTILSIGVTEGRKFLSFDVFMAYLHAKMDEDVFMTLDEQTTELLLQRDKELNGNNATFFKNVVDGKATVRLNKALYGCIQ